MFDRAEEAENMASLNHLKIHGACTELAWLVPQLNWDFVDPLHDKGPLPEYFWDIDVEGPYKPFIYRLLKREEDRKQSYAYTMEDFDAVYRQNRYPVACYSASRSYLFCVTSNSNVVDTYLGRVNSSEVSFLWAMLLFVPTIRVDLTDKTVSVFDHTNSKTRKYKLRSSDNNIFVNINGMVAYYSPVADPDNVIGMLGTSMDMMPVEEGANAEQGSDPRQFVIRKSEFALPEHKDVESFSAAWLPINGYQADLVPDSAAAILSKRKEDTVRDGLAKREDIGDHPPPPLERPKRSVDADPESQRKVTREESTQRNVEPQRDEETKRPAVEGSTTQINAEEAKTPVRKTGEANNIRVKKEEEEDPIVPQANAKEEKTSAVTQTSLLKEETPAAPLRPTVQMPAATAPLRPTVQMPPTAQMPAVIAPLRPTAPTSQVEEKKPTAQPNANENKSPVTPRVEMTPRPIPQPSLKEETPAAVASLRPTAQTPAAVAPLRPTAPTSQVEEKKPIARPSVKGNRRAQPSAQVENKSSVPIAAQVKENRQNAKVEKKELNVVISPGRVYTVTTEDEQAANVPESTLKEQTFKKLTKVSDNVEIITVSNLRNPINFRSYSNYCRHLSLIGLCEKTYGAGLLTGPVIVRGFALQRSAPLNDPDKFEDLTRRFSEAGYLGVEAHIQVDDARYLSPSLAIVFMGRPIPLSNDLHQINRVVYRNDVYRKVKGFSRDKVRRDVRSMMSGVSDQLVDDLTDKIMRLIKYV